MVVGEIVSVRRIAIVLVIAVLVVATSLGWQVGAAEVANLSFQEDIRDLAAQAGAHIGYLAPKSDDDLTATIIQRAQKHDIALAPSQIVIERIDPGPNSTLYITAHYVVTVRLGTLSFKLHFAPTSER
jgi:hypothetical protein